MIRLAVKYNGIPLMPMKSRRVSRYVCEGRGCIRYDRKLHIHYLQLLNAPSSYEVQDITIGLDPGSVFDGISVVSAETHHANIELIQREKKGKTAIKTYKASQLMNRRARRSRLRHRQARFDNRTKKNKMSPTIRANVDFRKWVIARISTIYPISRVVIEKVAFNHYKNANGRSFSHVEQGQNELYRWVTQDMGIQLITRFGYETANARINYFGGDPKIKIDKGARQFEAHCVDSFILACDWDTVQDQIDKETGEIETYQLIVTNRINQVNRPTTFIEKIVRIRRQLTRTRQLYKDKKYYYRLEPGGVRVDLLDKVSSKRNICRVKINDKRSNHPVKWKYIDNGYAPKRKCRTTPYMGGPRALTVMPEWINRKMSKV